MADLRKVFAENLKSIMEERQISPTEFAKAINKTTSYVSQLRSGAVGFTADSLEEFARALRCEPWELIVDPTFYTEAHMNKMRAKSLAPQLLHSKKKADLQEQAIAGLKAQIELLETEQERLRKLVKSMEPLSLEEAYIADYYRKNSTSEISEIIRTLATQPIKPVDIAFIRETLRLPPRRKVSKPKAE